MPKHFVVIPAAGVGHRMGAQLDGKSLAKQYLLLHGKTLLEHTVMAFLRHPLIDLVVVVVAPDDTQAYSVLQDLLSMKEKTSRLLVLAVGGTNRQSSVLNGLTWLLESQMPESGQTSQNAWVLVHDAARPGLQQLALQRLIDAVHSGVESGFAGGILALPLADSLKRARPGTNLVLDSPSREDVWSAQTPQMFRLGDLKAALEQSEAAGVHCTDEASAIERGGGLVALVRGERRNLKITVRDDLEWLEAIWTQ
jgi:2-C-methyl-D-erythritol 4-phosphate cytidylyltransferase